MSLHLPISVNDALTMLDSRIPLTAGERRMIVEGLHDLAFTAGVNAERQRIGNALVNALHWADPPEYEDPTTTIRRKLEDKHRG